ncbi:hypothetical protein Tcan_04766 [Toxocara canis]|uniref:Uncharacterized protein n=1 Tax=Toxocara canis TaxID=6265 RepID=A0A0B2W6Y3_TOXCA|nr:hypothetical protein Tcan_04766 [Toxocara canis]
MFLRLFEAFVQRATIYPFNLFGFHNRGKRWENQFNELRMTRVKFENAKRSVCPYKCVRRLKRFVEQHVAYVTSRCDWWNEVGDWFAA